MYDRVMAMKLALLAERFQRERENKHKFCSSRMKDYYTRTENDNKQRKMKFAFPAGYEKPKPKGIYPKDQFFQEIFHSAEVYYLPGYMSRGYLASSQNAGEVTIKILDRNDQVYHSETFGIEDILTATCMSIYEFESIISNSASILNLIKTLANKALIPYPVQEFVYKRN